VEVISASGLPVALSLDEVSKVGEARRLATAMANGLGFDETGRGRAAIVVTEAATNLYKHARGGEIVLRALEAGRSVGLEVLALDRGPGMADVGRCMTDGVSTAGSPGNGLGAMARLSSSFDLYSSTETGTAALARLWQGADAEGHGAGMTFGVVSLPLAGEEVCGDAWVVDEQPGRTLVLVVDGLGHGLPAADAAREAVESFRRHAFQDLEQILRAAHESLRKTRGAAMAVASVEHERREVRFAGIGNISGVILSPRDARSTSLVSHNGTVGHTVRKVQVFAYPWSPDCLLVMHSDGLATQWQLGRYPGLTARQPGVIAGVLYRDFRRERDDVTVLVAKGKGATSP
jgi:anti-sigma regulatory factor (Ser/Thr protein kinase)